MPYDIPMPDEQLEALIENEPFAGGGGRAVYRVPTNQNVIIKKTRGNFLFNYLEWLIWNAIKSSWLASIFGECKTISPSGRFLMMEKLDDLADSDREHTPEVPDWLTDRKPCNFGKDAAGKIKVRDYGSIDLTDLLVPRERA
jgi:hypothetical protein